MDLVNVDFKPMAPGELEYILDDSSLPKIKIDAFEVIADEEALELYFPTPEGWSASLEYHQQTHQAILE